MVHNNQSDIVIFYHKYKWLTYPLFHTSPANFDPNCVLRNDSTVSRIIILMVPTGRILYTEHIRVIVLDKKELGRKNKLACASNFRQVGIKMTQ